MVRKTGCLYIIGALIFVITLRKLLYFYHTHSKEHSVEIVLKGYDPVTVSYNELIPNKRWHDTVVLLHVSSMGSTWEMIRTPQILRDAGYRVISVTLPAVTVDSSQETIVYIIKGKILMETLKLLQSSNGILVVPSLTGSYALPVVLRSGFPLRGFVAISPVNTELFTPKEYKLLKIPSMAVYGQDDAKFKATALKMLKLIPKIAIVGLPKAGPSCYIEQPEQFHNHLLEFLAKNRLE